LALTTVVEALITARAGRGVPAFDTVVVDTAPSGHTLRLLELPAKALGWIRALMGVLLKYRAALAPGGVAQELVATSRGLKELSALLADPRRTHFVVVSRAGRLPRLETHRMMARLRELHVPLTTLCINALTPDPDSRTAPPLCRRCREAARSESTETEGLLRDTASLRPRGSAVIFTPAWVPPPRGVRTLRSWKRAWIRR
jgi:arsenite/tail-anchored protein-transporting ATPase